MRRTFIIFREAWYFRAGEDAEIQLQGGRCDAGSVDSEFSIRWLAGGPMLEVDDDGWALLWNHYLDLLQQLAAWDDQDVEPERIADWLRSVGVEDVTERSRP